MRVMETKLYNKKKCCGCSACMAVCPRKAITMVEDIEGFLYPKIDEEKCVMCNRCIYVCPNRKEWSNEK